MSRLAWTLGTGLVCFLVAMTSEPVMARPLGALIFIAKQSEVVAAPPAPVQPIDASRVPLLATPSATRILVRFIGSEITEPLLNELRDVVQQYFVGMNRPFVVVSFPLQDVTGGVLQVLVTESTLEAVRVNGNRWFDAQEYSDAMRLHPGAPIDSSEVRADVDWINQNPYRHASVLAAQGAAPGTTDLIVNAQDRFPVTFSAGINNGGALSTGITQLTTGFDWGNALFRGDDLNYTYTTTPDWVSLQQNAASYTTYLPSHAALNLSGTYATSKAVSSPLFESTGLTQTLSFRFTTASHGSRTYSQQLSLGADYKRTNNDLLFGGTSVFPTATNVYDIAASYSANASDKFGGESGTVAVFVSPGGWGPANSTAAFNSQQQGATAQYAYLNANGTRSFNLPGGATLQFHATAQLSSGTLLASEQLNFGQPLIFGFPSSFATRDEGVIASMQIAPRAFPLGLGQGKVRDSFAPFVFVDFGSGWNRQDFVARSAIWMVSVGPAFSYQFGHNLTGLFNYGFVTQHSGLPAPGGQAGLALQYHT
jgi:hemolysin activation/secretion protein